MARCLTVLIALLAQGMALMSPVCFVRCIGADGHQCVELAGLGCHRCDSPMSESSPQVCAVATCCDHRHDQDEEQETPAGLQIVAQECSCQHSPMESAPQNLSKSLVLDVLSAWHDVLSVPMAHSVVADLRDLEDANVQRPRLRPQGSPHLIVLATVVLRV